MDHLFDEDAGQDEHIGADGPKEAVVEVEAAKYHMHRFFFDKRLHTGGAVSRSFLYHQNRLDMVMRMTLCDGVDRAYAAMGDCEEGQDIRTVIDILNLLARSGVPQRYAGGMLCVYLELVEGCALEP